MDTKVKAVRGEANTLQTFNVLVRHTPFLLKQLDVDAASEADAKAAFLSRVEAKHRQVAARQQGPEKQKAAEKVMQSYQRGLELVNAKPETFVVRIAEVVKAEKESIKAQRDRVWGAYSAKE